MENKQPILDGSKMVNTMVMDSSLETCWNRTKVFGMRAIKRHPTLWHMMKSPKTQIQSKSLLTSKLIKSHTLWTQQVIASNFTHGTPKSNICGKVKTQDLNRSSMTEDKIWIFNSSPMEHRDVPSMVMKKPLNFNKHSEKIDLSLLKFTKV